MSTMKSAHPQLSKFFRCLEQQESAINQLANCASEQQQLIEAGSTDSLVELLNTRQSLIEEIMDRHSELNGLAASIRNGSVAVDEDDRQQIQQRVQKISGRLGEILAQDEQAQQQLYQQRVASREQLTTHDASASAQRAYAAGSTGIGAAFGSNRFADERG